MQQFASMGDLDVWYARLDAQQVRERLQSEHDPKRIKKLRRAVAKARSNDGRRALGSWTQDVDGKRQIGPEPPLIVRLDDLDISGTEERLEAILESYIASLQPDRRALIRRFRYEDSA